MYKNKFTALAMGSLLAGSLFLSPSVQAENFDQTITNHEANINKVNKEIDAINKKTANLEKELSSLNSSIEENETLIKDYQTALEESQKKVEALKEEIKVLEDLIQKREEQLADQARVVQLQGHPVQYVSFVLEANSLSETFSRIQTVSDVVQANKGIVQEQISNKLAVEDKKTEMDKVVAQQIESIEQLEVVAAELGQQRMNKEVIVNELALERSKKESDRKHYQTEIAAAKDRKAAYEKAMAEKQAEMERARVAQEKAEKVAAQRLAAKEKQQAQATPVAQTVQASEAPVASAAPAPAPQQAPASSSALGWPADGRGTSSPFGMRFHPIHNVNRLHAGLDVVGGGNIYAAEGGTVVASTYHFSLGNYVKIDHGNGLQTVYGHMATGSVPVSAGQTVSRGQRIGTMGTTGSSTGVHLHFEVHQNGSPVNPSSYL